MKRSTDRCGGKMKKSTARCGGKMKRSSSTRSAGKSLKDEKEDGPHYYVPSFYRSGWYETLRGTATEIPMPRLTELAAKLVESYNETEGMDFELVEAVKGFTVVRDDSTWSHLNFKAKLKDSPSDKFFFGELENDTVPTCCIIDPNDTSDARKMCDVCNGEGQVLLHPDGGGISQFAPPASYKIEIEPPVASNMWEYELIKAGGSEEKATKAYREFLHRTYAVMAGH